MQNDTTRQTAARRFSSGLAALVAVLSGTVLAGWALGLPGLYTLLPYGEHIRPLGAVCILALSLSLCVSRGEDRPAGRILARAMGGFVLVIASLNIAELGLGLDFGLDNVLFPLVLQELSLPGRLSLYAALSFFLSAAALILFSHKGNRAGFAAQAAAITSLGLVGVVLGGYLLGAPHIMTPATMLPMPEGMALLAVLLNLGLLTAHPEQGPCRLLLGSGPGSSMLRRFLPLMVVAPFSFGIASMLIFSDYMQSDQKYMMSSAVISTSVFFSFLLFYIARAVNRFHVELQKSEESYRLLVETANEGIWSLDADHRTTFVNWAMADMLGYSPMEMLGRKIHHFVMSDELPEHEKNMSACKSDQNEAYERCFRRLDGSELWTIVTPRGKFDAQGTFVGSFAMLTDITEKKKAEKDLLESSEKKYELLVQNIHAGVVVHGSDTHILFANMQASQLLGLTIDQLIGKTAIDHAWCFVHEDETPMSLEEYPASQVFATLSPIKNMIIGINRPSTSDREWVLVNAFPEFESDGQVCQVVVTFVDITDLKLAEKAIKESESRFHLFMLHLPAAIFIKDEAGTILYSNPYLNDMFGWIDPIGKPTMDLLPSELALKLVEDDRRALEAGYVRIEEEISDETGQLRMFDTHKFIIPIAGKSALLGGIAIEITNQKIAELALLQAKDVAETATRTKSEFLAIMSHEIRTPLNGVLGMLQLMEMTSLDDEQKEYIFAAIKSSKRLTSLLSDILDLSRIEAGKLVLDETEFEINKQKESVMELFAISVKEKGLGLDFLIDERIPPTLIGDKARLRQILFNLVGNAIKFTEKGSVRVEASPLTCACENCLRVLFTVSDTGCGIPDDRLKDIFDPFVQVDGSQTRRFQGAGLGLSIVRKLLKLMGGDLSIGNTEGGGTTIYVSLPFKLQEAIPAQAGQQADQAARSTAAPLRVLIADDDEVSLWSCQRILEKSGYAVTTCIDGQEALQLLSENDFDLILMDIQMLVMDGVEATKAIRASTTLGAKSRIPIIALTAYAMTGDKEKFLAAGMDDYIAKPVDMAALKEVIERVVERKNRTSGLASSQTA